MIKYNKDGWTILPDHRYTVTVTSAEKTYKYNILAPDKNHARHKAKQRAMVEYHNKLRTKTTRGWE